MKNLLSLLNPAAWLIALPLLFLTQQAAGQYVTAVATANPDYTDAWASPVLLLETANLSLTRYPTDTPARLKLLFTNGTRADLSLTIRNDRHTVLFRDIRNRRVNGGWWVFDLSELPDGRYTLSIRAGQEQAERTFSVGATRPVPVPHGPDVAFE
jgi:hypothetical protein